MISTTGVMAQVISTAVGNGADAFITSTQAGTNFGDHEEVAIKNDSGTGQLHRKGYFRFDVSGVQTTPSSASLHLVFAFTSLGSPCNSEFDVYGLVDGHPDEAWGEFSMNWSNAPANAPGGTGLVASDVTHLGTLDLPICTTSIGDTITFSSPQLASFIQADTNGLVTLIVIRRQANLTNQTFATKESTLWAPAELRLSGYETFCACTSAPCGNDSSSAGCVNSTGAGSSLIVSGSASVLQDDLVLTGTDLPLSSFAIFFMGGGQVAHSPFGDGTLCVSPGPASFCRFPAQPSGSTGTIVQGPGIVAYSQTLQPACWITPGTTWNFQAWYRDATGPCGTGYNLTDGVSVTFGL